MTPEIIALQMGAAQIAIAHPPSRASKQAQFMGQLCLWQCLFTIMNEPGNDYGDYILKDSW